MTRETGQVSDSGLCAGRASDKRAGGDRAGRSNQTGLGRPASLATQCVGAGRVGAGSGVGDMGRAGGRGEADGWGQEHFVLLVIATTVQEENPPTHDMMI